MVAEEGDLEHVMIDDVVIDDWSPSLPLVEFLKLFTEVLIFSCLGRGFG